MFRIRNCPEVELYFQGTGMNGWLVSAVYDNDEDLIDFPTRKKIIYILIEYLC